MEKFLKEFLLGEINDEDTSNIEIINHKCLENLEKSFLPLEQFNEQISSCKSSIERIQLVAKYFEWIPVSPDILQNYTKNSQTSTFLREKANQHYAERNYKDALSLYNLAINFSPLELQSPSSQEQGEGQFQPAVLGLAFANRSATLLLGLQEPSEALKDIDLAVKYRYPPKLIHKLEDRRKKCFELLNSKKSTYARSAAEKNQLEFEKRRKFCQGILFKVKSPNKGMPAAEEFVQFSFDPIRGRQLIVNRDIPAGTVLVVEKPFVSVLKNSVKWDVEHCHFCLKRLLRGVPCTGCVFATYCDETCRLEAWKEFHELECPCLAYLHLNSTPRYILLAFRIVCKLGPGYLFQLFSGQPESMLSLYDSFTSSNITYDATSYSPIYNLVSHSTLLDPTELYSNALQALILSTILEKYSLKAFLKNQSGIDEHSQKKFTMFLASILLHHIENIPCNSISLDELEGFQIPMPNPIPGFDSRDNNDTKSLVKVATSLSDLDLDQSTLKNLVRSIKYPQYGAGVFSVASLVNHSCDPNVIRINDRRWGTLAIVTTRGLRKGEEILTCYSRSFINDQRDRRLSYLNQNYYFNCQCIACTENWPVLASMLKTTSDDDFFCCGKCSTNFKHDDKSILSASSSSFRDCVLNASNRYRCRLCSHSYTEINLQLEFSRNIELFFEAYNLVLRNEPVNAIRCLLGPLKYFQYNICPPFSKCYMSQDIYKQALELIVYFSQTL